MAKKKENVKSDKIETDLKTNNNLEDAIEESANNALMRQNKKQRIKVVIISLLIVILIAAIGITFYVLNNPRLIFNTAINNMTSVLESNIENVSDSNINFSGSVDDNINNFISNFNNFTLNEENIKPIISGVKDAFLQAASGEKITGSDMVIKVNGQDVETNRVSLAIDDDNITDFTNKFINSLKNDNEFLTAYSNMTGISKKNIQEKLDELKQSNIAPLTISIYTSGITREFVKLEISNEENNMTNVINLTKINDNEYDYKIVKGNESSIGTVTFKNDNIIIDYTNYDDETITASGTLTVERQY